uniref:Ribosomal protein S5 domain 2-like superfamily protein n=1 Tax=Melianthus villosus TaxID=377280 RepID=A0A0G4AM89_9ROSI|nr:ribosomal protein S5 domain 2-like superfamily protein [Melianthus villosus]
MLSRIIPRPYNFRLLSRISSIPQPNSQNPNLTLLIRSSRFLSSSGSNNGRGKDQGNSGVWKFSSENEYKFDQVSGSVAGITDIDAGTSSRADEDESWLKSKDDAERNDVVGEGNKNFEANGGGADDGWITADGFKPWSLAEEKDDIFDFDEMKMESVVDIEKETEESNVGETEISAEERKKLELEEKELKAVLKGPNRAFGDLISASGITDAMLDSLIALKDLEGVEGLPPLEDIEDMRYEKNTRKSTRAEIERRKQEEIAKARVRQVDDKGRAYGTGRRKCSIARVWIQPGDGKFIVNDKEFDVYFPVLDHRAALLRPFSDTKTLGLWDVNCTVKGGGVSGQVGAIQLGASRALQNWEPDMRPALKSGGFLTRDSRVVERKKPGKAKARKSFQWVKR